jgi:outer membrane biosynthesis protein TonB
LAEELARTSHEFARDPRGFIRDLFADDTKDAKRRRRIYFGLVGALVIHAVLLTVIAVIGWRSLTTPKEVSGETIHLIDLPGKTVEKPNESRPERPHGDSSGGGSDENLRPATKGAPPPMAPAPQIVKPLAPSKAQPSLPVQAIIPNTESTPSINTPVGIPDGVIGDAPAPGIGKGEGIGGGNGTNAGPGDSSGKRDGRGTPDGNAGMPKGNNLVSGPIPFNRLKDIPGNRGITWIRRPYPITTPEAQANKYKGEVFLKATFNADGTITDIDVIHEVPYGMTESAIDALKHSRFHPATINGQPVTLVGVPVRINIITELH